MGGKGKRRKEGKGYREGGEKVKRKRKRAGRKGREGGEGRGGLV